MCMITFFVIQLGIFTRRKSVCYPVLQIIDGLPGAPTQSVWSKAREVFYILAGELFVLIVLVQQQSGR